MLLPEDAGHRPDRVFEPNRIRRQLRALQRELAPHARDPAIRELRAQVAGAA
jgi:hypothetical protein